MTVFGVDYSGARPDIACMVSKGVKFAARYLEPASDWKTLTLAESTALRAAGIAIVGIFETAPDRALQGFTAGALDATGVARESPKVGMPANRPFFFNVDFNATPAQMAGPITQYFKGIRSVLPLVRIGGYGGYNQIKYLFDNDLIAYGWQTYAWSGGRWDSRAHLQQYNNGEVFCGGTVDFNRAMVDDYGQWPAPPPPQLIEGDEEVTEAEITAVAKAVRNEIVGTTVPVVNPNGVQAPANLWSLAGWTYAATQGVLNDNDVQRIAEAAAALVSVNVSAAAIAKAIVAELS